jgi:HEPN/RES N-terminal domain 1/RES domain
MAVGVGSVPSTAARIALQPARRHQSNSSTVLITGTVRAATNSGREYTCDVRSDGCSLCWWLTMRTPPVCGFVGAELGPGGEVPVEVPDEGFLGGTTGGLDLDQPPLGAGADQQVGRLGAAEQLVEVDGAQTGRGEHRRHGGHQVAVAAVEQAVPDRFGGRLPPPQVLLEVELVLRVPGLQVGEGLPSGQFAGHLQVRVDEVRRPDPAQRGRHVHGQGPLDQPVEDGGPIGGVRDDAPALLTRRRGPDRHQARYGALMGFWKSEMIRREEEGWSATTGQYVCSGCVDDVALKSALDAAAKDDERCDFCGTSPATDMSVLLELFVSGLKTEFGDADSEGVYYDGREGGYQGARTWDTADLVWDFADVLTGEGLVDAVIAAMTDKTWVEVGFAGPRHDEALSVGWERFCEAVKYETRYVFWLRADQGEKDEPGAGEIPAARILQEIGAIVDDDRVGILRELPAGFVLWRAQPHEHESEGATFRGPRLGTAPRETAVTANRMSPAGIPMFYGATDQETAFAETAAHDTRPWATAGAFRTSRPCLVVDFTRLPTVPSMFDPDWRPAPSRSVPARVRQGPQQAARRE